MAPSEHTVRASRNRLINDRDAVPTDVAGDGYVMADIDGANVEPDLGPSYETIGADGPVLSGTPTGRAPDRFDD